MHTEGKDIARRLAGELLIAQERLWDLRTARAVSARALSLRSDPLSDKKFRPLAQATYRVGSALDQVTDFETAIPWDIQPLQARIDEAVREWFESTERHEFVCALAAHIKNKEPFRPRLIDWTPEINRFLRHTSTPDRFPDLMAKLAVARLADDLVEERRAALIAFAEQELEIRLETVADALLEEATAAQERMQAQRQARAGSVSAADPSHGRHTVIDETQLEGLCSVAHPAKREDFVHWLRSLPPLASQAAFRRISMLASEPLVHRLWVKPIVQSSNAPLRELRLVAQDIHYRVLFVGNPNQTPQVLAFGLRRDLADLIDDAQRLI